MKKEQAVLLLFDAVVADVVVAVKVVAVIVDLLSLIHI